ncbi:MAG: ABC transporter substrate-binding protein [Candidatus Bathyarchaeia archaeon]
MDQVTRNKILIVCMSVLIVPMLFLGVYIQSTYAQLQLPAGVKREEVLVLDLVTGKTGTPSNFNAWRAGADVGILVSGINQLCTGSLWYVDTATGEVINGVAASPPEANADFTVWRIKLRQGIYWSDGTEITAEDVVYTLNSGISDKGLGYNAWADTWISEARAEDKYTVVVKLKESNAHWWSAFLTQTFASMVRIMPKHVFEKAGVEPSKYDFNPPVCAAMYTLQSFDPTGYWYLWKVRDDWKRSFVYQVYKEHWGTELKNPGPKYVLFIDFGTPENKIYAMSRGDLDMIMEVTPEAFETLIGMCNTCRGYAMEFPYAWMLEPDPRHIRFNLEKYPLNLKEVRWALALSTNMTEVGVAGFQGILHLAPLGLAAGPVEDTFYFKAGLYAWLLNYEITLQDGTKFKPFDPDVPFKIVDWAISQGYLKARPPRDFIIKTWGVGWWKYAPDVAEKLLKSVGFSRGADGMWRLPDGTPWKIEIYTTTYEIDVYRTAFAFADQWRKFGVDVTVNAVEQATFFDTWNRAMFEDIFTGWSGPHLGGLLPGLSIINFEGAHSKYWKPRGEFSPNSLRLKDSEVDRLIDQAMRMPAWEAKIMEVGVEMIKHVYVEEMYAIGTIMIKKFTPRNEQYWTGYPSAENPYWIPYFWGMNFALALPKIQPKAAATQTTTETVTSPPTLTATAPVVTTKTETITQIQAVTTTLVESRVDWAITIIASIALLIVGIATGWLIRRR